MSHLSFLSSWNYQFILSSSSFRELAPRWVMEDSTPAFVSCSNTAALSSQMLLLSLIKVLWRAEPQTTWQLLQEGGVRTPGLLLSNWASLEVLHRCFLCAGRSILIIKCSATVEGVTHPFLGLGFSREGGVVGWGDGCGTLPFSQKKSVSQIPDTDHVMALLRLLPRLTAYLTMGFPISLINAYLFVDMCYHSKHQ